ncbi:unnamed protein product, partial [Hapterophycus canaliculatus]
MARCAGPSRCLDAIIIALEQASDGKRWYTSTKELQLASLQFCAACRSVPVFHLRVDSGTPTRLWTSAAARGTRSAKKLSLTRVPAVRAREVTWGISAAALRNVKGDVLSKVEWLSFGNDFNGSPIHGATWPESLQHLTFEWDFNQPIEMVRWPASLQVLSLGIDFNQPIKRVSWPSSLRQLILGRSFNQPINGVSWPASLQEL